MQINYDILSNLDEKTLEKGLFAVYRNAKELDTSSVILAKEEKFAIATALKLLSVEELVKAQSILMFIIGVRNKDIIDLGFKKNKNHKTVHQTRLTVAAIFNELHAALNTQGLEAKLTSMLGDTPERFERIEGEGPEEFIKRVVASAPSINELLNSDGILTDGRLDKVLEKNDDWLCSAQSIKEKCMYVDIEGEKWTSPFDIKISDYLEADKRAKEVFSGITSVVNDLLTKTEEGRRLAFLSLRTIMNRFLEDAQSK
jgi:AbiV family abortive infection protein